MIHCTWYFASCNNTISHVKLIKTLLYPNLYSYRLDWLLVQFYYSTNTNTQCNILDWNSTTATTVDNNCIANDYLLKTVIGVLNVIDLYRFCLYINLFTVHAAILISCHMELVVEKTTPSWLVEISSGTWRFSGSCQL